MKYLFIIFGVLIGAIQFLLLRKMTSLILSGGKKFIIIIVAKLLIYAVCIAAALLFFRQYILFCGIGLGLAMACGSFINFVITDKSEKKGDDAA